MYKFFQTIKVEHERPLEGTITGEIPSWVEGSLYRNGPGIFEVGEDKYKHWFDPLAMLQRFQISDKKAYYQCRYLRSETYKTNMEARRIVVGGFGTASVPDPCKNIFQRILSVFEPSKKNDNCLVSFWPLKDELYAATEGHVTYRVDPETLESMDRVDLSQYVAINLATAHPHWDPDGTVHNLAQSFRGKPKTCIIKIPPKTEQDGSFPGAEIVSAIESEYKTCINYYHSFGMTENYYVYVEQPLLINFLKMMKNKVEGKDTNSAIIFYDDIKARFRIIDKRTGETVNPDVRYEADPFCTFHHMNAYEDNGHIVLDLCSFKNKDIFDWIYLKNLTREECESNMKKFEDPEPHRYVIPLNITSDSPNGVNLVTLRPTPATAVRQEDGTIHCTREVLAETGFEFPQINYALYNGKKYRYVYGLGWNRRAPIFHTVCKLDLDTKTYVEWKEEKCFPSEPVFVGNPNGNDEDDGVVLSAVNCTEFESGKRAFLLVLDAKTMKEIARADFNVPRFPKDFHGMFRPSVV